MNNIWLEKIVFTGVIFLIAITACASDFGHKNFILRMQNQVGKSLDDAYTTRNQYPERRLSTRVLSNGNTEEEFRAGRGSCRVFFEIDNKLKKIVGWRYEGRQDECIIPP